LLEIVENMRETLAGFLGVATRGWKTEIWPQVGFLIFLNLEMTAAKYINFYSFVFCIPFSCGVTGNNKFQLGDLVWDLMFSPLNSYDNKEIALNCGLMLRECIKFPTLAK
jgi:hypothetical protein